MILELFTNWYQDENFKSKNLKKVLTTCRLFFFIFLKKFTFFHVYYLQVKNQVFYIIFKYFFYSWQVCFDQKNINPTFLKISASEMIDRLQFSNCSRSIILLVDKFYVLVIGRFILHREMKKVATYDFYF